MSNADVFAKVHKNFQKAAQQKTETSVRLHDAIEKCRLDYVRDALWYGASLHVLPRLVEQFERERLSCPLHGGQGCIA